MTSDAKALIVEGLRRRQEDGVAAALDCFTRAAQLEPKSYLPLLMLGNAASEFRILTKIAGNESDSQLAERDPEAFWYVFHNTSPERDLGTERLRGYADEWRDFAQLTDAAVMELIARDRIDILVDLSEHTHGGRLTVFAGRAAVLRE